MWKRIFFFICATQQLKLNLDRMVYMTAEHLEEYTISCVFLCVCVRSHK